MALITATVFFHVTVQCSIASPVSLGNVQKCAKYIILCQEPEK